MSIMNALASVAVKDLNSAVKWYEKLLGRPADSSSMREVAEWKFEQGGWLQVYQLSERAGSGSFTLAVSNIEEQIAHLQQLNIDTSQRTSSSQVKTLMIADPDGMLRDQNCSQGCCSASSVYRIYRASKNKTLLLEIAALE